MIAIPRRLRAGIVGSRRYEKRPVVRRNTIAARQLNVSRTDLDVGLSCSDRGGRRRRAKAVNGRRQGRAED